MSWLILYLNRKPKWLNTNHFPLGNLSRQSFLFGFHFFFRYGSFDIEHDTVYRMASFYEYIFNIIYLCIFLNMENKEERWKRRQKEIWLMFWILGNIQYLDVYFFVVGVESSAMSMIS